MRPSHRALALPVVCLLLVQALALTAVAARQAAPRVAPGNPAFQRTWARTDYPVSQLQVQRTWMWGPEANTGIMQEQYEESPGDLRDVQYFDKSRMEITHPGAFDDGLWYVTNGLLVVELVSGQMQIGDASFEPREPAAVNITGDPGDESGLSPTYADIDRFGLRAAAPRPVGFAITQTIDANGVIGDDPSKAALGVTGAQQVQVPGIYHTIASVFWEFMNSDGTVWEDNAYTTEALFINPYYATGYPITEAYWSRVLVNGSERDVLWQCFERRCLTWTPGNPAGFLVEAGNVGQHYYRWRYDEPEPPPPTGDELLINEVMAWPEEDAAEWVELHNPGDEALGLAGWVLANGDLSSSVELPDWIVPPGAYLVVWFTAGTDDDDLDDGRGDWYAGAGSAPFFAAPGAALYDGPPSTDTIVDIAVWSFTPVAPAGGAVAEAVTAGIWPAGRFYSAAGFGAGTAVAGTTVAGVPSSRRVPVTPSDSFGRDRDSSDTDSPEDWASHGGPDAAGPTPGARNVHLGVGASGSIPTAAGPAPRVITPQPPKTWTVMVFLDGRDPRLFGELVREINRMELSGSDDEVNVVVQIAWRDEAGQLAAGRVYVTGQATPTDDITSPQDALAPNTHAINPGDPQALTEFIEWSLDSFPAQQYAIVFGGHAAGWKGLLLDGPEGDFLTMSELSDGLSALGQPFENVRFDAPLLAQTEVAYQIEPQAETMTASQQVTWGLFPWDTFIDDLRDNTDWSGGQFSDRAAQLQAAAYEDLLAADTLDPGQQSFQDELRAYTWSSIDLATVAGSVVPAVSALGSVLEDEVDDVNEPDNRDDNDHLVFKHEVLEQATAMDDQNFLDLYHLAALLDGTDLEAGALAPPVALAVDNAVRWEAHGEGAEHANQHGLTIYAPHDQLLPDVVVWPDGTRVPAGTTRQDGSDPCASARCESVDAYDDPLFDPAAPLPTDGTHLYQLDGDILLPSLLGEDHPMHDDPAFRFPAHTEWDELLHRYYKPVADACARDGDTCVDEITVDVGDAATLSGNGSSDSDGPEGPSDDQPAHEPGLKHYYWDFRTSEDNEEPLPIYLVDALYVGCGEPTDPPIVLDADDCDRDGLDETDDDVDAKGQAVAFPCTEVGDFVIRLMLWDEHHDHGRVGQEETGHNDGRHWLHFNVDSDTVLVHCEEPLVPDKVASETATPGGEIDYLITLPAHENLVQPTNGSIVDQLRDELFEGVQLPDINGLTCSSGACEFDPETLIVSWEGTLEPGDILTLSFSVPLPTFLMETSITNCATVFDGLEVSQTCDTTVIEPSASTAPAGRAVTAARW